MSPRVEFSSDNKKATTNYDYPKLKLKVGESARIVLLEQAPTFEYVHTLNKPQIVDGKPIIIESSRKDGSKYKDYKMDFVTRVICLGDESTLDDAASDPKNCPVCALAKTNPDMAKAPARRFATNVIRYKTKAGGTSLVTPYSVETLVWAFTENVFNKIADAKEEWDDLRKHDLILGPCEAPEMFQKFPIAVAAKAAWGEDAARKKLTVETFKENAIEDLSIACGTRKEKRWVDEDVAAIKSAWAVALGNPITDDDDLSEVGGDLDAGLDDLLKPTAKEDKVAGDVDDLFASDEKWADEAPAANPADDDLDLGLDETPTEVKKAPAKKPAAKTAPEPEEEAPTVVTGDEDLDDLDALLGLDD